MVYDGEGTLITTIVALASPVRKMWNRNLTELFNHTKFCHGDAVKRSMGLAAVELRTIYRIWQYWRQSG